jgi:tetratricopeptide (TPR) repeat protein
MIPRLNEIKPKDNHPHTLAKQLARMSSVHNAAVSILKNSPQWDCTMVFYETIDTIGHHFMQFLPPQMPHVSKDQLRLYGDVMLKVYEHHDHALGELLQHAGPDTTVLLLSDHGFHSGDQRPVITQTNPDDRAAVESSWHRSFGVLVMSGAGIKRGEKISAATLLDITPTALALLGLPVGADMDGRVLAEAFAQPYALHIIESWDTKAGEAGMHSDDLRNNPFESQDALNQLIDLGYMPALGDDMKARLDLVRRESDFNLAVVYMSTGRAQLAEPLFAELSRQKPNESRFTTNLANCQFSARNFAACAQTVTAYLLKHPTNAEARLLLVGALANLGKTDEAKTMLARLESDGGDRPELAMSLGDMHGILGQWNDAARLYRRSEKHDPQNPRVQVALARVSLATAKWDDALEFSLNALEIQQITPEAHHALGIALAWLGDYPHAIQSFDNALHLQSGLIQAHQFMVILSELVGNQAKAQKHKDSVEQLLATLKTIDGSIHQPPAESWGPQAWAKSIGRTTEM